MTGHIEKEKAESLKPIYKFYKTIFRYKEKRNFKCTRRKHA